VSLKCEIAKHDKIEYPKNDVRPYVTQYLFRERCRIDPNQLINIRSEILILTKGASTPAKRVTPREAKTLYNYLLLVVVERKSGFELA